MGGTRQKAAEIALPARSGPPSSTERTRGLRVVIPSSTLRPGKENKSGAQARPLEEKEGQSRHPGRRVQRPPRPLRECSRSEERPSCLLMGLLPPHTPEELSGDSMRRRAEERPRPGTPGCATSAQGLFFPPTCWGGGCGGRRAESAGAQEAFLRLTAPLPLRPRPPPGPEAPARCSAESGLWVPSFLPEVPGKVVG